MSLLLIKQCIDTTSVHTAAGVTAHGVISTADTNAEMWHYKLVWTVQVAVPYTTTVPLAITYTSISSILHRLVM